MTNKLVCPSCNKAHLVDDYIQATDANMAFNIALSVPVPLTHLVLKYTQLFAPAKSVLTLNRRAKIIESMHLEGCEIERVAYGIAKVLENHASGSLQTPLKSHGYLQKVMTGYTPPDQEEVKKYKFTEKQAKYFACRLCRDEEFAMKYARVGEESGQFMMRIENDLHNPDNVKNWYGYIDRISQADKQA